MEKKLPLVSIVAINYNNSKYVIETLDSIAQQTYENIELLIVDDCSTDDSIEKIEHWLLTFNKPYQLIKHAENQGVCKTINDGYKAAKGKYISSIATDDTMLPQKIENQVKVLESTNNSVGMLYSDTYLIDENGVMLQESFLQKQGKVVPPSGDIYETLLWGNFIPAMSILVKRTVFEDIGYFDEKLNYEDYDMWLRISKKYQIIFSNEFSAKYRIRISGLTLSTKKEIWNYNNILVYYKHQDNKVALKKIKEIVHSAFLSNERRVKGLIADIDLPNLKSIKLVWGINFLPHKIKISLFNRAIKLKNII